MPETEIADIYADRCNVVLLPFGSSVVFSRTKLPPIAPNVPPQAEPQAVVRMTTEHLKAMTFVLWRQVRAYEKSIGHRADLSSGILKDIGIVEREWRMFWYGESGSIDGPTEVDKTIIQTDTASI